MTPAPAPSGSIVHEIRWSDALPWWIVFRAAGAAFSPTVILLAALGAGAAWAGPREAVVVLVRCSLDTVQAPEGASWQAAEAVAARVVQVTSSRMRLQYRVSWRRRRA